MSTGNDSNVRLTSSERNSIILNESRGIHHPLYYVCHTKSGKVQVRKRRTPLVSNEATQQHVQPPVEEAHSQHDQQSNYDSSQSGHTYSSVSNRELLERMLDVLQKNVHSNDEDKNSVENERITQDNQQFIDNIVKANEAKQTPPQSIQAPKVIRRGRVLI